MKGSRIIPVFALATILATGAIADSKAYAPGQIIVKFKPSSASAQMLANKVIGSVTAKEIPQIGVQTIKLRSGMSVDQALRYYRGLSNVQYAEPDYIVKADFVPNDPKYNTQYAPQRINMPTAWDLNLGNSNVKIAIIDSGIDYNHPDLAGKVTKGKDYVNSDNDPMDDNGHGTHCAGNAAAKTNNGVGIAGIGFNCSLAAYKVLGAGGSGLTSDTTQAIIDATDAGVDVISMSLGSAGESTAEGDAVNYAWNKGVVLVAAAGNDGVTAHHWPGAFENCICVGASDSADAQADFSNFGADWVDVAAPGVDILSTLPGNQYAMESGTSMATPVVAGLVGLMKSYAPDSTNVEIRKALEDNCDDIGTWIAKGRVNGFKALNSLIIPLVVDASVNALAIYKDAANFSQGIALTGTTSNLAANDNKFVSVASVLQPGIARVSSIRSDIPLNVNTLIRTANIQFSAKAPGGVTIQVFVKKGTNYELLKSYPGNGLMQSYDLPVPTPSSYVSNGTMSVVVRGYVSLVGHGPTTHTLSMDMLKMHLLVDPK